MEFFYKIRGYKINEGSLKGRQCVYFTCHPDDFEPFFDEIADDIQRSQNCAVLFTPNQTDPLLDDKLDLLKDRVRLFVVPITSKFLFESNRARETEFKFARENNIPILPLIRESGLESSFNEICGELQFLDKLASDHTAIPFEKKLRDFLNSVLLSDDTLEKIRAAFDAYVFLSYRKKDRKYATELMRLIHKNDFCRDIAIWYDEYLTPGENFNSSIKKAFEKSGLFVMAVTPSLLEKVRDQDGNETDNYIVRHEYPMALRSGKPILPAELVPTDGEALKEKYKDIPTSLDAHNEPLLNGALLEAIGKMDIKENNHSPEHNFFIGLAYLAGIDVETDPERAISLITDSAENGLCEAIERLVYIYCFGTGTKIDRKAAIHWQKVLVKKREEEFCKNPESTTANSLIEALTTLGVFYIEGNCFEEGKSVCLRLLELCEGEFLDPQTAVNANGLLADISEQSEDYESARTHYLRCVEILEKGDKNSVWLCRIYNNLGNIEAKLGNNGTALELFEKSLEISNSKTDSVYTGVRADTLRLMGGAALEECNLTTAKLYGKRALETDLAALGQTKGLLAAENVASDYSLIAAVFSADGDLEGAQKCYDQSLDLFRRLQDDLGTPAIKHRLAMALEESGVFYESIMDFKTAEIRFSEMHDIAKKLTEDHPTAENRIVLSNALYHLASLKQRAGDIESTVYYHGESLKLSAALEKEYGSPTTKSNLAFCYEKIAIFYCELRDFENAVTYSLLARELREKILEKNGTLFNRRALNACQDILINALISLPNHKTAERELELLLCDREKICEQFSNPQTLRDLALCREQCGDLAAAMGDFDAANRHYRACIKDFSELSLKTTAPIYKTDLIRACCEIAVLGEQTENIPLALEFLPLAIKLQKEIGGNKGPELADICEFYGRMLLGYGKQKEAAEILSEVMQIYLTAASEKGTAKAYIELAEAFYRIGSLLKNRSVLEHALKAYGNISRADPNNQNHKLRLQEIQKALDEL